ncbi:ArnT family glycosyltransferase [Roseobacter ponti]|uniref:Glycosyltransferase RgtA/B/C/D-like domain-containing protein n=1 Tax=Roseobacter ponti TaxID=1891787 RepID=A0A858SQY1_9RHOB|nr:hypothetical protein [Roseobacter ponti]QJF50278.1 hypothetical protein G3256_03390 [Roseobacter ponti]
MSGNDLHRDAQAPETGSALALIPATVAVFLLAAATRLLHLSAEPHFDELYHVLAARGLIEYGEPRILGGLYERALGYTGMIAIVFTVFGESLEAGRLTSVLFGSALVAGIFVWVRHLAGRTAGLVSAAMAILWPTGIEVSQMIRFYAPFGLVAFLGFVAVYTAVYEARAIRTKILLASLAVILFVLALRLQEIMIIGLVGLGVWVFLFLALPAILAHRYQNVILLALLGGFGAAAALMWQAGLPDYYLTKFRWAPEWVAHRRNEELYYSRLLYYEFPLLWPWMPFAAMIAIARFPRPGVFCVVIFGISLLLHSLAGMKSGRYIYYVMPLMFAVFGMAAAVIVPAVHRMLKRAVRSGSDVVQRRLSGSAITWGPIAVAGVFALAFLPAPGMLTGGDKDQKPWQAAAETVRPWIDQADVVASNQELYALYFLGRADLTVSSSRLSELSDRSEFSTDFRTGLPVISDPASIRAVLSCTPTGLFIISGGQRAELKSSFTAVADALAPDTTLRSFDIRARPQVDAFYWETMTTDAERCADITGLFNKDRG